MIKVKDDGAGGSTVHVVTREDSARACPSCGVFATRLKDYRTTSHASVLRLAWIPELCAPPALTPTAHLGQYPH